MCKSYYEDCFEEYRKKVMTLFYLVPLGTALKVIVLEAVKDGEKSFKVLETLSAATTDLT